MPTGAIDENITGIFMALNLLIFLNDMTKVTFFSKVIYLCSKIMRNFFVISHKPGIWIIYLTFSCPTVFILTVISLCIWFIDPPLLTTTCGLIILGKKFCFCMKSWRLAPLDVAPKIK